MAVKALLLRKKLNGAKKALQDHLAKADDLQKREAELEKAIEEGYGGRVFSGFPAAILFIDAEPDTIDVNIHPGKREIRFLRQDDIRNAISGAVRRAVMTDAGVPKGFVKNIESPRKESLNNTVPEHVSVHFSGEQASIREYLLCCSAVTAFPILFRIKRS